MEKEYVLQIAQTIKEQLVGMTPAPVIMSWGITEFAATIYRDLPALRIKLNGRLHTGSPIFMSFISFIFTTGGRCRHASGLRSVYSRPNGFIRRGSRAAVHNLQRAELS